jgi:MFS family permease
MKGTKNASEIAINLKEFINYQEESCSMPVIYEITNPVVSFAVFCILDFLIFVDRGIVPGSTVEFTSFIVKSTHTSFADAFLGGLQASFIVGLIIGSLISGHLVHKIDRFTITGCGIFIWFIAALLSGAAYYSQSFSFLLIARILSGFGEASLLCNIPPWIQDAAPPSQQGLWLGIFYTTIPFGTAVGYAYSAVVSATLNWSFSFFIEAIISLPLIILIFFLKDTTRISSPSSSTTTTMPISILDELYHVLSSSKYLAISFGSAGMFILIPLLL